MGTSRGKNIPKYAPFLIGRGYKTYFTQGKKKNNASHVALVVKNLPANARDTGDTGSMSGSGRSLEEEMAILQ